MRGIGADYSIRQERAKAAGIYLEISLKVKI